MQPAAGVTLRAHARGLSVISVVLMNVCAGLGLVVIWGHRPASVTGALCVNIRRSASYTVHALQREVVASVEQSACRWRKRTMSANKTKKVKMATKSCPDCDQQVREYICQI